MSIKLAVFDLDGTLLRGDTVCLALARRLGRLDRMQELENLRDLALIKEARHEMAAWYEGRIREELQALLSDLRIAPGADEGCALLRRHGIRIAISSMTWTFAVELIATRLGASHWTGSVLDFDTRQISHSSAPHKAEFVRSLRSELGLAVQQVAAIGDSWGDIDMLNEAGYRFYVGHETPEVANVVHRPDADIRDLAELIIGAP